MIGSKLKKKNTRISPENRALILHLWRDWTETDRSTEFCIATIAVITDVEYEDVVDVLVREFQREERADEKSSRKIA
jgi:hypothetical protein